MVRLLHFSLDPFSRRTRLSLAEMGLAAELNEERPWEMREAFLDMNPSGTLPVLIDDDGTVCAGVEAVGGYLDEQWPLDTGSLWGTDPVVRAEVRRLVAWFDGKFHHEVTSPLLMEKVVRRFVSHLAYINALAQARNLLVCDDLTVADLAAASHLSVADYLGDLVWDDVPDAKAWYQRIKSRPSFRSLLADQVRGMPPSSQYSELDF
jgi:glutathione S-transferase